LTFGAVASALNTSPVTVNSGGTFGGTGSVLGSTVTVESGGTLAPGASVGTLTVGNATIDGKLLIEYSGNTIDLLNVASGFLDITNATVDFSNLGAPLTTGAHVFATYSDLGGSMFASELNVPSGFSIDYDYLSGNQIALVGTSPSIPGDYNDDGKVDAADYVVWRKNPGAFLPDAYETWRSNFGNPPGSGAGASTIDSAAVPEPSSIALIALGVVLFVGGRNAGSRHSAARRAT
jgi:hypothetical protein